MRQEALRTLAIVGFVMEDKKVMLQLCEFIGRHYIKKRLEEEDVANKREQSASDGEDSDVEENEGDSEPEESDEQTSSDADSSPDSEEGANSDAPRPKRVKSSTYEDDDTACALEVCTFLLAMFSSYAQDDHQVRCFISRYREALSGMLMAKEGPDIAGTPRSLLLSAVPPELTLRA